MLGKFSLPFDQLIGIWVESLQRLFKCILPLRYLREKSLIRQHLCSRTVKKTETTVWWNGPSGMPGLLKGSPCCCFLWAGTEECFSLRVRKAGTSLLTIKQLQLPPLMQLWGAGWNHLRRCTTSPKQQMLNLTWNLGKKSPEKPKALNPADVWPGTKRLA